MTEDELKRTLKLWDLISEQQEKIYELEIQNDELRRKNEKLEKENEINICWLNYYTKKYHDDYEIY